MYIEVLHDPNGAIAACYCADTLPVAGSTPLVSYDSLPQGLEQCRLNIDTLTAMEIEASSGQTAVLDAATGQPRIVNIDRAQYIMENFSVNVSSDFVSPAGASPPGMKLRGILKKV